MYSMLRGKNNGCRQETIALTKKLIQTPSNSHNEEKVATLVEQEMVRNNFDKVFRDRAGNVVGILYGRETTPAVLLCSHMDAMAADNSDGWTTNPYAAEERDGKIYGRGAADCKGGIAAQLMGATLLKRSLLPLQGTVIVAATVTEKNGISAGTRILVNETLPNLGIRPTFAILGEPTDLGLYYGHNGWMEIDVTLTSANTFNVLDAARAVSTDIATDFSDLEPEEFELHKPSFTDIPGGREATIRLRRRLYTSDKAGDIVAKLERRAVTTAKSIGPVSVTAALRSEDQKLYTGQIVANQYLAKAWSMDPFHPLLERVRNALEAGGLTAKPDKWKLGDIGKGTSGSVLFGEFGIPTIGYGPGNEESAHSINEYVDVDKLSEGVYGTALIAHGIAGIPVCGWTLDDI